MKSTFTHYGVADYRESRGASRRGQPSGRSGLATMSALLSVVLSAVAATFAIPASGEATGTVELTLDGEPQTWYVVDPGEAMLPNALWVAMGPDRAALSITAYPTLDVEFTADETTGSPLPNGDFPALVISVGFSTSVTAQAYKLPPSPGGGPASVALLADWSNPLDHFALRQGPGEIRLTEIDTDKERLSSFAGSFHGTMQGVSGGTRIIENGRFEVRGVVLFEGQ